MTYAIRNTLIIFGVWLVLAGAGWARFYLVEDAEINRLEEKLAPKKVTLQEHQTIADNYDKLMEKYQKLKAEVDENAKVLVKARDADEVYSNLISLSADSAFTYFNFIATDSTHYDNFGLLKFDVSGEGYYRNFNKFVNRLEYGRSLFKVRDMTIEPITNLEHLGKVHFSFKLQSLFDRDSLYQEYPDQPKAKMPVYTYNSFYPLIHDVEENEEGLPDVENSVLVSVGEDFISLRDQNDNIKYIYTGDRVYLGKLLSVDTVNKSATFRLNKGGIIKYITRGLE